MFFSSSSFGYAANPPLIFPSTTATTTTTTVSSRSQKSRKEKEKFRLKLGLIAPLSSQVEGLPG
jgi:hypothetical protein